MSDPIRPVPEELRKSRHGPLPTDLRVMVPRRAMAAWHRMEGRLSPLLQSVGVEPTPPNLIAAMLEILDGLDGKGGPPFADPRTPVYEAPEGEGEIEDAT